MRTKGRRLVLLLVPLQKRKLNLIQLTSAMLVETTSRMKTMACKYGQKSESQHNILMCQNVIQDYKISLFVL